MVSASCAVVIMDASLSLCKNISSTDGCENVDVCSKKLHEIGIILGHRLARPIFANRFHSFVLHNLLLH